MSLQVDKLNKLIDQLIVWLRQNQNAKLLSTQRTRLINILDKIINSEALNETEIKQFEEQSKKQKQLLNDSGYTICQYCGAKLNIKNLERHKHKCRGQKQSLKSVKPNGQKKPTASKKRKPRKKSGRPRAHIVSGGLPSLGKRR
jgi:hypothetical protein